MTYVSGGLVCICLVGNNAGIETVISENKCLYFQLASIEGGSVWKVTSQDAIIAFILSKNEYLAFCAIYYKCI